MSCVAAANAGDGTEWRACENTAEYRRYVVCDGYLVMVALCSIHRVLWDHDHGHLAIHAGAPVAESTVTA